MKYELCIGVKNLCSSNIIWNPIFPMRGGVFPKGHPVGGTFTGGPGGGQIGDSDGMTAFRNRGYWASCFPEGDGITFREPEGKDAQAMAQDIRECFGWEVKIKA